MSGSEDGQLRSSADGNVMSAEEDHESDSLDIKPPQMNASQKRKARSNKEGKHSKDRKHKERDNSRDRNREQDYLHGTRRFEDDHSCYRKDKREDMERKRYERGNYHHNSQQLYQQHHHHHQQKVHLRHRQDYYDQGPSYHHVDNGLGIPGEFNVRHQQQCSKHNTMPYEHNLELPRERRNHNYKHAKDAESLEQDLRSRLLSKRHNYVSDDLNFLMDHRDVGDDRNLKYYEDIGNKVERHKNHCDMEKSKVIEVLDSPEFHTEPSSQRRKHKKRNKERDEQCERRRTPDDPELLARRAKILTAEREKEKRKDAAREELEARRKVRKEGGVDLLSPSVVAASVTAGLHVLKRKIDVVSYKRKKWSKDDTNDSEKMRSSDYDSTEFDENDERLHNDANVENERIDTITKNKSSLDDEKQDSKDSTSDSSVSHTSENSNSKYAKINKRQKKLTKHMSKRQNGSNPDYEQLNGDSPSNTAVSEHDSQSQLPHSHSSRSYDGSDSESSNSSESFSRSDGSRSCRSSRSSVRSKNQSYSIFRLGRHSDGNNEKSTKVIRELEDPSKLIRETEPIVELKPQDVTLESTKCVDTVASLPNYYPGIQGCRSVEEFQCLNRIEEGTYGVVYRARDKRTNEIVALKRLKMEKEKEGFPITSLREINTLLKVQHPNIVTVREIVVGSNMDFIVMDYVEHDLKSLMETMKKREQSFLPGEVKCLTEQLLRAVAHLHDNWILHRDLKTSNLLLSHKGILKVGDFGLAREYGSPLSRYTLRVVTLWYRAPELLLCSPEYSTPIDIWSVGCIFAEFLKMTPLFQGESEIDQLNKIFKELGTPNEKIWPGYNELPAVKNIVSQNSQFAEYPVSNLHRNRFHTTDAGISLLGGLLTYDPKQRLTAEAALTHSYFKELPLPIDPSMFPTWPAKSEMGARKVLSPKPPSGGSQFKQLANDGIVIPSSNTHIMSGIITGNKKSSAATNTGFVLNAGYNRGQPGIRSGFK